MRKRRRRRSQLEIIPASLAEEGLEQQELEEIVSLEEEGKRRVLPVLLVVALILVMVIKGMGHNQGFEGDWVLQLRPQYQASHI